MLSYCIKFVEKKKTTPKNLQKEIESKTLRKNGRRTFSIYRGGG